MKSFRAAMAWVSVAMLLGGLLYPHLAATFLRVLLATLAAGYLGARVFRSGLPAALWSDTYSPFDAVASPSRALPSPPAVAHMTTLLRAVTETEAAGRASIPPEARRILEAEASRRLLERHGLSPRRSDDRARIRALVSDPTWTLIRAGPTPEGGSAAIDSISMSHLEHILDDVERL